MQPAFSVIFFTVASGAGLGLLDLVSLADVAAMAGINGAPWLTATGMTCASALGLALTVAGLCASTLHLANPGNAWRSLARIRTSWLSREALAAILLITAAAVQLALRVYGAAGVARGVAAAAVAVLAWALLYCTAMIYASLKPIRQWHTRWTPAAYLALAHWSGAVLLLAVATRYGTSPSPLVAIAIAAGIVGVAVKWGYWRHAAGGSGRVTLEHAIGVERGVRPPAAGTSGMSIMQARLLDAGHTRGTFLTREFGFTARLRRTTTLRGVFWVAGFALPMIWIIAGLSEWRGGVLAGLACIIGLAAERWLFFADARHTVRLFHGDRHN
jgi:sulfite dehydrogenase (quinone) subunit SoeC